MVPIYSKLPSPWTSKAPKRYKQKKNRVDIYCSKRIPSNFDEETPLIKDKFMKADYHCILLTELLMNFKRVKNVKIKVL